MGAWGYCFQSDDSVQDLLYKYKEAKLNKKEELAQNYFKALKNIHSKFIQKSYNSEVSGILESTDIYSDYQIEEYDFIPEFGCIAYFMDKKKHSSLILEYKYVLLDLLKIMNHNSFIENWADPQKRAKEIFKLKTKLEHLK